MANITLGQPHGGSFEIGTRPYLESLSLLSGASLQGCEALTSHQELAELILVEQGRCRLLAEEGSLLMQAGNLALVGSGTLHGFKPGRTCSLLILHAGGLRFRHLLPGAFTEEGKPCLLNLGPEQALISQLLQNIKLLQVLPESPERNETAAGLIQALLPLLPALIAQQASGEKEVSSALRIKEYIDAHYLEELKLSTIASALHVSTYYLSHTFKDLTGDSPMQYIIKRRMDAAQNLLLTTNYSITDIAMRCGYNNSNYFQSVFNNLVGMPPGKYRKAWKGN